MAASTRSGDGHGNQAAWPHYMERFQPLERLGEGINDEVFKAWDTQAERIVAVKRLSTTGDDGFIVSGLQEVLRECRNLKACEEFPSIVKLREKVVPAVESDDSFIVMEYAGRLNLRSYMQQRAQLHRRFREAEVRRIMRRILESVKSVHGEGILHLDIEPENVILDDGTEDVNVRPKDKEAEIQDVKLKEDSIDYKIGGFGMSRKKERGPRPEVVILTPYSAPELLLRSREYDERVDTWGLGCIMAELLSGTSKPTFRGETDNKIMSKVSSIVGVGNSRRLRRRFPWTKLSSAGFEVLSGLLESNRAKRLTAEEALKKPWFQEPSRRGFGGCFR